MSGTKIHHQENYLDRYLTVKNEKCTVHRLEQFYCKPDTLHGTIQNPKWICIPIYRFFKLCPAGNLEPGQFTSVEISPPPDIQLER